MSYGCAFAIGLLRVEAMLLHPDLIDLEVGVSDVLVGCADQSDVGKIVIHFDNEHALDGHSGRCQRARLEFRSVFLAPSLPTALVTFACVKSGTKSSSLPPMHNGVAAAGRPDVRLVESQSLAIFRAESPEGIPKEELETPRPWL